MNLRCVVVTASLPFLAVVLFSHAGDAAKPKPLDQLLSPDVEIRRQVYAQVIAERTELVRELICIVDQKKQLHVIDGPSVLAIKMLGELRSVEAVDTLIANIDVGDPTPDFELRSLKEYYPCVGALIKVGKPSSIAAVKKLADEKSEQRRKLLCLTIEEVEGKPLGIVMIENTLASAGTEDVKQNLRAALAHFKGK